MQRTKTISGWVELDTDPLDWIDIVLAKSIEGRTCVRHLKRSAMRPPSRKARDWGNRVLGISLRRDSDGTGNWHLPKDWRKRLERAGVDPGTLEIADQHLWEMVLSQLDIEDYRKRQRAVEGEEGAGPIFLEPLHIERPSNGEQSPAVAIEVQGETSGYSFGAPAKQSTPEIFSQRGITSGPPHKPRRREW